MALFLGKDMLGVCDVHSIVHINRMGSRQQAAYARGVRTGFIVAGNSVPGRLARVVRQSAGLPTVVMRRRCIDWANLTEEEHRQAIHTVLAAVKLDDDISHSSYVSHALNNPIEEAGYIWLGWDSKLCGIRKLVQSVFSTVSLPQWEGEVPMGKLECTLDDYGNFKKAVAIN